VAESVSEPDYFVLLVLAHVDPSVADLRLHPRIQIEVALEGLREQRIRVVQLEIVNGIKVDPTKEV